MGESISAGMIDNIVVSATLARNKKLIPGEIVSVIINAAEQFCNSMAKYGLKIKGRILI